jgi:hypothetical protein
VRAPTTRRSSTCELLRPLHLHPRGDGHGHLQAQLAALQTVYLQLVAGKTVASASYAQGDGNRAVTYRNTDTALVQSMIRQIQAQLGLIDQPRRSAGVSF